MEYPPLTLAKGRVQGSLKMFNSFIINLQIRLIYISIVFVLIMLLYCLVMDYFRNLKGR